jgi:hypothetical protein
MSVRVAHLLARIAAPSVYYQLNRYQEFVMHDYRVIALDPEAAQEVRTTLTAPDYGHPAHVETATGYGPCRLCLDTFKEGEEKRILFTHDPFADREPYPLPGPIFIHEYACERFSETNPFPARLRFIPFTFNAYGRGRNLLAQHRIENGAVEDAVKALFSDAGVDYIHVRNTEAGCFIATLERGTPPAR